MFIGAACPWFGPPPALERAVEQAGARLVDVGASTSEDACDIVAHADVVHLGGGYHRYLVDYLTAGSVGEALACASDAGAVVWGTSAGAIALGTGGLDLSGDDGPAIYPGLDWIDAFVFPHFQGSWDDVEAHLPAGLAEEDGGGDAELDVRRHLVPGMMSARVREAQTVNHPVLVVPHEGAVVAEPGWQRFSPLQPFPDQFGGLVVRR